MNDRNKEIYSLLEKTIFEPALKAQDKQSLLAELADLSVARGVIPPEARDAELAALTDREKKMSTGMQYGIAIPHAKTDLVQELVTMVALSEQGIAFETLDGEPAQIFIATLSPPSDANSHIRFLAYVTRQLASRRIREKVLAAKTHAELLAAFAEAQ